MCLLTTFSDLSVSSDASMVQLSISASTTLTNRTDSPLAIWNSKQSAQKDAPIILLLHVDDMLLFSPSANPVTTINHLLRAKYKTTDLAPVRGFLFIEIERDRSRRILHIHQQRAVRKLLVANAPKIRSRVKSDKRHSKDS